MRKAVWVCVPFSAAVFVSAYLLSSAAMLWVGIACACFSLSGLFFHNKNRLRVLLCLLGAAAGFFCSWGQNHFLIERCDALCGEERNVTVRVVSYPEVYDSSEYLTVRIRQYGLPNVKCKLVSYESNALVAFVPGDEVSVPILFSSATIREGEEIDSYTSQGIFVRGEVTGTPLSVSRPRENILYYPARLAHYVQTQCHKIFPSDTSSFFEALLTGEKRPLYSDGSHYYYLRDAGLAHVVAVSGMHVSFLMGFLFLITGRRRLVILFAAPVLLVFAALTGFTPSVCRAALMQMGFLCAPMLRRQSDSATALFVVLAILLLINPNAAASISLQLSFASVGGIFLLAERLNNALIKEKTRQSETFSAKAKQFLAGSLSTSLAASAFTLPLTAVHFGTIPVIAPLTNILCLWVISAIYIGGYLLICLSALLPGFCTAIGGILAWGVRYLYGISSFLVRLPCATVSTDEPVYLMWLALAYILLGAMFLSARHSGRLRPVAPICLVLISLYASAIGMRLFSESELSFTALDVGQGSCSVICCGKTTAIIDCGGSYSSHPGATAVNFLLAEQRRNVDALVLTHLHSDHCNGAAELMRRIKVAAVYLPLVEDDDEQLEEIVAAADETGVEVFFLLEDQKMNIGDLSLTLYAPVLPGGENENCLFVLATYKDFDILITGDNSADAERILCAHEDLPDTEILLVGHHGSSGSTSEQLLQEIRPDVAVISVGYNKYGHPSNSVLHRLDDYGIPVLRTDEEGSITLTPPKELKLHG